MKKWVKKTNPVSGEEVLESNSTAICLPIKYIGTAKNIGGTYLDIRERRKKYPSVCMHFYRSLLGTNLAEVLDGKKILVTIEVLD